MASSDKNPEPGFDAVRGFDPTKCQGDFECEFFGRILARNPRHVDVLRRQAELLASRGDYDKALTLDRRLAQLLPNCCGVYYNLACSLAMTGHVEEAMSTLRAAIERGYRDVAHLELDADLDVLRDHPDYRAMLDALGQHG